jgi:intracellular proteinase inhibitor BsuPI
MNTRWIILLLCAGAVAFACAPRNHSDASTLATVSSAQPSAAPTHARTKRHVSSRLASRLKVDVAPRAVRFALDVVNVGQKHVEVDFPSGQSYDFSVVDSTGREVWHWSKGHLFTQSVQNKQLGAGDAMQVSESWQRHPAPGKYTAIATLESSNYPLEQRVDFVVQ